MVTVAVALVCLAGCDREADPPPDRSRLADCSTGPWADHCPEARRAREVAGAAGFTVTGDTGSALTIERSGEVLHLWAFTPEEPELRATQLREEGYGQKTTVGGLRVHGDGIRVTWKAYGLYVWLADAVHRDLDVASPLVADLVRASTRVAWP